MLYFAYGSNMLRSRLENQKKEGKRIGKVIDHGMGILFGYGIKFNKKSIIDGSGKTNIIENNDSKVLGVVYKLTDEQFSLLEKIEAGYEKLSVQVFLEGNAISVDTFLAEPERTQEDLLPTRDYLNFLVLGAREHNFPRGYVESLENAEVK